MTESEMQAAQERLDAVTPGKWRYRRYVETCGYPDITTDTPRKDWKYSADTIVGASTEGAVIMAAVDGEFIAHAPEDLRKALAALKAAREDIETLLAPAIIYLDAFSDDRLTMGEAMNITRLREVLAKYGAEVRA